MIEARDERMSLDTEAERSARRDWSSLARPQGGVDAIADRFPNASGAPEGVVDSGEANTRAVPVVRLEER